MATESIFAIPELDERGAEILCDLYEKGQAEEEAYWRAHPNGDPSIPKDPLLERLVEWHRKNAAS